jgi:hypothetical protein
MSDVHNAGELAGLALRLLQTADRTIPSRGMVSRWSHDLLGATVEYRARNGGREYCVRDHGRKFSFSVVMENGHWRTMKMKDEHDQISQLILMSQCL